MFMRQRNGGVEFPCGTLVAGLQARMGRLTKHAKADVTTVSGIPLAETGDKASVSSPGLRLKINSE